MMVSWPPMIMTAEVLVHEGINRTTVLGDVTLLEEDNTALLDEDLITVDDELLSLPGCALAHIAVTRVSRITRVIDLYHTIIAPFKQTQS